jgi:hypothetical protein
MAPARIDGIGTDFSKIEVGGLTEQVAEGAKSHSDPNSPQFFKTIAALRVNGIMGQAPEAVIPSVEMTARMVHCFRGKNASRGMPPAEGGEIGSDAGPGPNFLVIYIRALPLQHFLNFFPLPHGQV